MNLANMVRYRADLSAHIGKNMYIEIVDEATADWGLIFADDFNTYHETIPTNGVIAFDISTPITNEIENPNFETGDLSGWNIKGNAFGISDVTTYWGTRLFNQEGTYHMWGFVNAGDDGQGEMTSKLFKLGGNGTINFLIGGGKDINNLYVTLVRAEDNTELEGCKSTGSDDEGYMRVTWDASPYLGEIVYIKVADKRGGGFGHINVDDFQVYNVDSAMPDSIENANFETGDLTGWTATGEAFANAVTSETEIGGVNVGNERQYHLWSSDKTKVGELKSSEFYLAGTGKVKMLLAGNSDADNLYVALVKAQDNTELLKVSNVTDSSKYKEVTMNAAQYVGTKVYLKIVDKSAEGFISVDDIRVMNFGAAGKWSFDEARGKIANDSASNTGDQIEYVFNNAKYKPSSDPKWMGGIKNSALLFDGYSTWITREANKFVKPSNAITIEGWVAPRTYEWGDLGQMSIIVNQHNKGRGEGFALGIGRHGTWSLQLGVDKSWFELWAAADKPIELNKWSYITATYNRDTQTMKLYLNGQVAGERRVPLSGFITASTEPLIIGRHNQAAVINGTFFANMFDGLMDELTISYAPTTDQEVADKYNTYMTALNNTLPEPQLALDRSDYDGDMHRPQYHYMPPGHWMNEPHGPIYYNGKYHIFYQANPRGPYWHYINWGHAVSDDMVHWEEQPIAIMPQAGSVAPDGIWSGSTTFDQNGKPVIFFTAGDDSKVPNQSTGIAFADDYSDPSLKSWSMHPELVTIQTQNLPGQNPGEVARFGDFRDPFVFKDGDTWYQLVTSGIEKDGKNISGTALVYKSKDLFRWEYMGPLFQIDRSKYPQTGRVWELPVLLPLNDDGGNFTGKHIFMINPTNFENSIEAMKYNVKYVFYWIGTWNKETGRFIADHEDPRLFDYGEHFTGPSGMVDNKGRSIVFSIAQDTRSEQEHYDAGWAHNAGLPLELTYVDNTLRIKPIEEELKSLRRAKLVDFTNKSMAEANALLKDVKGDMLEISVELEAAGADKYGIKVRRSPDGQEETLLFYDETAQTYNVDRNKTTLSPDASKGSNGGSLELKGDTLKLHIYIDRSMIEAYANGLKSITTRAYPTRFDALGLQIWGNGDVMVKSMQVWEMGSAYGEVVPVTAKPQDTKVKWGNIANAGFETGDLTGWTVEGNAFTNKMVTETTDWGWGGPFNQAVGYGEATRYHLWGYIAPEKGGLGDAGIGSIKSDNFILGGDGKINFLVGGGQDIDRLYVALVRASDNTILMKATGRSTEQYGRVTWDASQYIGEELYIKVVDNSNGGFGHINVDDFHVPVDAKVITDILDTNVEVTMGQSYSLPEKVTAIMSDNSEEQVSVNWILNTVDTSKAGEFAYNGSVEGYQGEVSLYVTVKEPIVTPGGGDTGNAGGTTIPDSASVSNTGPAIVISAISSVASNGKVTIDVTANKSVAKEIFDAIKGTDKTVTFIQNGIEWSFNGKDITGTTKTIDMTVNKAPLSTTTSSNKADIGEKVNNENVFVISFANNGQLPGKAKVKVKLDAAWLTGKNKNSMNVYYYNEATKAIETIASGLIVDAEGYVVFNITHNSDYIVTDRDLTKTTTPVEPTIVRLGGANRYETSVKVSKAGWTTSDNVVLARGDEFADALTAAPFAKQLNAPILLTSSKSLDSSVKAELARLKAKKVYVIGGTGAISSAVVNTITAMGIRVERISGSDRYATSLAIADKMTNKSQVFLATGTSYADALSISSYAAATGSPILLTAKNQMTAEAVKFIKDNNSKVYVIGGTGVISEAAVKGIAGAERIAGADRYATNLAVLNKFTSGYNFSNIYLATGANYPDAICGSALAGKEKAPIILVNNSNTTNQKTYIKSVIEKVSKVKVLGGEGVISSSTVDSIVK